MGSPEHQQHQQQEESKYRECTKSKPVKKCLFWLIFLLGWTVPLTVKGRDIKIMRWYLIFEVKDLLNIFFVVLDFLRHISLESPSNSTEEVNLILSSSGKPYLWPSHPETSLFCLSYLIFMQCIHSWGICSPAVHQQYNIWIIRLQK